MDMVNFVSLGATEGDGLSIFSWIARAGADLAGAIAAAALSVPTVVTMPKGCLQRDVKGKDGQHTRDDILKQIADGVSRLGIVRVALQATKLRPLARQLAGDLRYAPPAYEF